MLKMTNNITESEKRTALDVDSNSNVYLLHRTLYRIARERQRKRPKCSAPHHDRLA